MTFEFLTEVVDGRAVTVTLNRPPVNAVNQRMYTELRDCFSTLAERYEQARVIVVRGAGKHFCAGNDKHEFAAMTQGNASSRMRHVREAFAAIYECTLPTVAVVTGAAIGTGMVIASCCDVVFAADDAVFGAPEVSVGVMGGGRHLARLVGEHRMRRMYFQAKPVAAVELASTGAIVAMPADALDGTVAAYVAEVALHSRVVLATAKTSLNRSEFSPLKAGYETEQEFTIALAADRDSIAARAVLAAQPRRR